MQLQSQGLLEWDAENSYFVSVTADEHPTNQLPVHSIAYGISVDWQENLKVVPANTAKLRAE
jgi:hypothetical protein